MFTTPAKCERPSTHGQAHRGSGSGRRVGNQSRRRPFVRTRAERVGFGDQARYTNRDWLRAPGCAVGASSDFNPRIDTNAIERRSCARRGSYERRRALRLHRGARNEQSPALLAVGVGLPGAPGITRCGRPRRGPDALGAYIAPKRHKKRPACPHRIERKIGHTGGRSVRGSWRIASKAGGGEQGNIGSFRRRKIEHAGRPRACTEGSKLSELLRASRGRTRRAAFTSAGGFSRTQCFARSPTTRTPAACGMLRAASLKRAASPRGLALIFTEKAQ